MAENVEVAKKSFRVARFRKANRLYRKMILNEPKNVEARKGYVLSLIALGEYEKALREIDNSLEVDPELPQLHVWKGEIFLIRQEYQKARQEFCHAVEIDEASLEGYFALGSLARVQKKNQEAEKWYKKVLEYDPDNHKAFMALSGLFMKSRRYLAALRYMRMSLRRKRSFKTVMTALNTFVSSHRVGFTLIVFGSLLFLGFSEYSVYTILLSLIPISYFLLNGILAVFSVRKRTRRFGYLMLPIGIAIAAYLVYKLVRFYSF
jgi:tetratricopeptide (TPR) repeat protein